MGPPRVQTTVESLPREVLSDIFFRLLAKQLAKMRCVCKPWNALLSEDSFIKSHLHHSIHNNDEILLFFPCRLHYGCSSITARPTRSPDLDLTDFIKLPVNLNFVRFLVNLGYAMVIGSVNGVICVYYKSYHDDGYAVYIWNPSLSALLTLPPCSLPSCNSHDIDFRFGYDPRTDDYKVVKITGVSGTVNMLLPQAEVYSMRKGSWDSVKQRMEMFPSHVTSIFNRDRVCTDGHDGHIHWLSFTNSKRKPETIVAFDLGAETFSEIPLPDSLLHHNVSSRMNVLGVLTGKLCVMSRVRDGECEVWVMDEYGVADSWVKHHVFSQFDGGDIMPYGFTSRNEFLFRFNDDVDRYGLYDLVTAKTKTFKIHRTSYGSKIVENVDSLVWIAPSK
ncbi:F-box/kelch-repeat protein At3g06240 [Lactuca sativa]|uniref:F-box domain-containing protein n=1 Tax=Lactuca sativa TaxID=4236 RepID=A0A9R1ULP5_LACSA|nr:F-box/kelch-repeat protein At3g06240 [Lactuca sativa]XP_042753659.1 F-box/kelch-repeat protein At3g06240 [Lactuca sativa]KAJ0189676.1 hypothetical protein LSAT_V11C800398680 [Lactuca sativa]